MRELLQRGNVFKIKKGMRVYTDIPSKYVLENCRNSNRKTATDITVGEILTSTASDKTKDLIYIRNDIINVFNKHGLKIHEETVNDFLKGLNISLKEEQFNTSIFTGEYVVTHTESSGGGPGFEPGDVYPDGWKVTAKKLKNGTYNQNGLEVTFFQTGRFSTMIPPKYVTLLGDMLNIS